MFSSTTPVPSSHQQTLHSRKLLLPLFHFPLTSTTSEHISPPAEPPYSELTRTTSFDANVVMILSVLLCALICSLGLNSLIRCILRCTSRSSFIVAPVINVPSTSPSTNCPRLVNTGIKKKAIKTFTTLTYSSDHLKLIPGLGGECVICLTEFATGDKVRLLPRCNHGFHVRCIDKWLDSHSSCPTCRNCLIETCDKIVGAAAASMDNQQSASSSPLPTVMPAPPPQQPPTQILPSSPQETILDMAPLGRESPARNS